jgi:transposase
MRSNGVPNFPDPDSSGGIPKQAVVRASQAVGNSQADAASNACRHLLGPGGSLSGKASQPIPPQDREDYLKAATCMRSHGSSAFPDPTFQNNCVTFNIPSSINTSSPQVVELARSGTKVAQLVATFGMSEATVYNWLRQEQIDRGEISGTSTDMALDLAAAKRRIRQLETELAVSRKVNEVFLEQGLPPKASTR